MEPAEASSQDNKSSDNDEVGPPPYNNHKVHSEDNAPGTSSDEDESREIPVGDEDLENETSPNDVDENHTEPDSNLPNAPNTVGASDQAATKESDVIKDSESTVGGVALNPVPTIETPFSNNIANEVPTKVEPPVVDKAMDVESEVMPPDAQQAMDGVPDVKPPDAQQAMDGVPDVKPPDAQAMDGVPDVKPPDTDKEKNGIPEVELSNADKAIDVVPEIEPTAADNVIDVVPEVKPPVANKAMDGVLEVQPTSPDKGMDVVPEFQETATKQAMDVVPEIEPLDIDDDVMPEAEPPDADKELDVVPLIEPSVAEKVSEKEPLVETPVEDKILSKEANVEPLLADEAPGVEKDSHVTRVEPLENSLDAVPLQDFPLAHRDEVSDSEPPVATEDKVPHVVSDVTESHPEKSDDIESSITKSESVDKETSPSKNDIEEFDPSSVPDDRALAEDVLASEPNTPIQLNALEAPAPESVEDEPLDIGPNEVYTRPKEEPEDSDVFVNEDDTDLKETHFPSKNREVVDDNETEPQRESVALCAHSPVDIMPIPSSGENTPSKERLSISGSDASEGTPLMADEPIDSPLDVAPLIKIEPGAKGRSTPDGKEAFADGEVGKLEPTAPPEEEKDSSSCCKNKLFLFCATFNLIAPIPFYFWCRSKKERKNGNIKRSDSFEDRAMITARLGFTVTIVLGVVLLWLFITNVIP